jgi:hypothetical protein
MAYTMLNFRTKKELKARDKERKAKGLPPLAVFQLGPFGPDVPDGRVSLEGPHYPEAHKWYASALVKNGHIVPGSIK